MKKKWAILILVIACLLLIVSITPRLVGYIINSTGSCIETDNGKDYYVQGTATIGKTIKGTDYCINSSLLKEYSCSETALKLDVEFHNCDGQCKDGACVVAQPINNETSGDVKKSNIPWNIIIPILVLICALYLILVASKKGIIRKTRKTPKRKAHKKSRRKPSRKRRRR